MLNISKWNLFFVFSVCLLGLYYFIPNFYGKSEVTALPSFLSKKQVNLGLDLQGGSHLLLEVETKTVLKEESENLVDEIRSFLRKSKIKYTNLGSKVKGAVVTIKDKETGQDTIVPLTTKNKIWLTKNYPEVNLAVDQDTMTGDAKIAETIANETVKEKIKPADLGIKNQPVFETLESIKAILPYKMSGQEIMDKYEIGFKINKFTEFSPSK